MSDILFMEVIVCILYYTYRGDKKLLANGIHTEKPNGCWAYMRIFSLHRRFGYLSCSGYAYLAERYRNYVRSK